MLDKRACPNSSWIARQVRAGLKQMGCTAVPQEVRRHGLTDARPFAIVLEQRPNVILPEHASAAHGKQGWFKGTASHESRPHFIDITLQPMGGVSAHWHHTRLATLGKAQMHRPFTKVHILVCHAFQLADSHTRPVEHFQQCTVTDAQRLQHVRSIQQSHHLARAQIGLGRACRRLISWMPLSRIEQQVPLRHKMSVQALDRTDAQGLGLAADRFGADVGLIRQQVGTRERAQIGDPVVAQPLTKTL